MGQTVAEKIISQHAGRPVFQDQLVIAQVDAVMATDATAPFAIQAFREMGGKELWRKDRVILQESHQHHRPMPSSYWIQ
jgi:3-isopropylmalate/(R)-2-methylmalate dehydratase large subunit